MKPNDYMVIYPGGAAGTFIANLVIAVIQDCELQVNSNGSMDFTNPAVSNLKINKHNVDLVDISNIIITNCVDMEFLKNNFHRHIINVSFNNNDVENISQLYWLKTIKDKPQLMRSWPYVLVHLIKQQKQLDLNEYDFSDPVLNLEIFKFGYDQLINYHLQTHIPTTNQIKFADIFADDTSLLNALSDILKLPISTSVRLFIEHYRQTNWDLYPFLHSYKNKGK